MLKIFTYLKRNEWLLVILSVMFIVVQVWLDLKLPAYMAEITTLIQTEGTKISELLIPGLYMILCAIGSMIKSRNRWIFPSKNCSWFIKRLRGMVFEKTLSFSMEEINGFSTSSLITRSTNDITQIQLVVAMDTSYHKGTILAVWPL